eukprot:PLAT14865.1.p1 GENE.PLAT14865.1~~PLAT14865.1.p1  ORF type:complete len:189 (+),score=99.88 PLAT14865.1:1-567(+)
MGDAVIGREIDRLRGDHSSDDDDDDDDDDDGEQETKTSPRKRTASARSATVAEAAERLLEEEGKELEEEDDDDDALQPPRKRPRRSPERKARKRRRGEVDSDDGEGEEEDVEFSRADDSFQPSKTQMQSAMNLLSSRHRLDENMTVKELQSEMIKKGMSLSLREVRKLVLVLGDRVMLTEKDAVIVLN